MLSDNDFYRLMNDPRLGIKKFFFNKIIDDNLKINNLSSIETSFKKKTYIKPKRCNNCQSCKMKDCGYCFECLDKQKFGGPGLRKKRCIIRGQCKKFQNKI